MSGERDGGGGTEFERVLETLRARIADGIYPPGSRLPTQRDLAEELAVSRDTVQRVIRELNSEGWIKSRQGSGSLVVGSLIHWEATPRVRASLGTFIARAFAQPIVRLDVFTLTSESLDAHIRLQAERIRLGEAQPERIELRLLLPSESLELPYPSLKKRQGRKDRSRNQASPFSPFSPANRLSCRKGSVPSDAGTRLRCVPPCANYVRKAWCRT